MDTGTTIIGAGVIGLAIAENLSKDYDSIFLLEKHPTFGQETSSRNSEVIHAGIYYLKNSLKATLCVEGNKLLYEYCIKNNVPFNKCGKLIVATSEPEKEELERIRLNAVGNGVILEKCDKSRINELQPHIFATYALYSPETGIIDSHMLMKRYETNTLVQGGNIAYKSFVKSIRKIDKGYEITIIDADGNNYSFTTRLVINSAGLEADKIAQMVGINDEDLRIHFSKGEYFRLKPPKNKLLKKLVYPVPLKNMEGIGVHVTLDMGGGVKLGPDVKYLESNIYDYTVTPSKRDAFFKSAVKFLPFIEPDDIAPEMAGLRPKIQKPGDPQKDFYIREESERGLPGFINLIGMESPGLTSSLSIAKYVSRLVERTI
jgi:L-2-hydroxyglutarate oxidase LhgO